MNKNLIFFSLLFVLIVSCQKENFDVQNLNQNKIIKMGHGGMGISSTYPINSMESIQKCIELGMDGTELDVQMTKDCVLVAFHDEDLLKSTNFSGKINDYTWDELKDVVYSATPYLNYPLLNLKDLFKNLNNANQYYYSFDCKLYHSQENSALFYDSFINSMIELIDEFELEDKVFIESQSKAFLQKIKEIKPNYQLFIYPSSFENGYEIANELDLFGITISHKNINKEQVKLAHDAGFFVAVWNTQSHSQNIDAIKMNPDIIQTDKVKSLIKLLD